MIYVGVCPNCGAERPEEDGVLRRCIFCGDDETEPVDPEDVP